MRAPMANPAAANHNHVGAERNQVLECASRTEDITSPNDNVDARQRARRRS
jgi:hypothetical protein